MPALDQALLALLAAAVFGANLAFILRPLPSQRSSQRFPGETPGDGPGAWIRRHYATWLCLARGGLNGTVALFGLLEVGHPLGPSLAEAVTAGFFSGFFQRTIINERFSGYLNRASSEPLRILKWIWFQAIFYGLVKAAGTLAGGGPPTIATLVIAYAMTITFGSAQYPWEAAIAASRAWKSDLGISRQHVRFAADLQTMAVSVTCVGVSILNSVGVPHSRLFLGAVGVAGLAHYGAVNRRARSRRRAWVPALLERSSIGDVR